MTRMTGPDCAAMCNIINTHRHTPTDRHIQTETDTRTLIPPWEDQCEWHGMTRMTGPDCAVICNSINLHEHTNTHTHTTHLKVILDALDPLRQQRDLPLERRCGVRPQQRSRGQRLGPGEPPAHRGERADPRPRHELHLLHPLRYFHPD